MRLVNDIVCKLYAERLGIFHTRSVVELYKQLRLQAYKKVVKFSQKMPYGHEKVHNMVKTSHR